MSPFSGLDPRVTTGMYQTIKSLNEEGISIIMISHDVNAAVKYASHILHIGHTYFTELLRNILTVHWTNIPRKRGAI